jgi:protein-tyrosine phosphatase
MVLRSVAADLGRPSPVDLHTHVLPGMDDGPRDMVGSVAMADIAATDGVQVLVATPHVRDDHPGVHPDAIASRLQLLSAALERHRIDVVLQSGAEVDLTAAEKLEESTLRMLTLARNGVDLLIETPHSVLPGDFEQRIRRLMRAGFRVVLAHPELSSELQVRPDRLERLVAEGVLVQITAGSLLKKRTRAAALAFYALERAWVHAIASDAHAPRWRSPTLNSQVSQVASARPDLAERLAWATTKGPQSILAGAALPAVPGRSRPRRRLPLRR